MPVTKRALSDQLRRFAHAAGLTYDTTVTAQGIRHVIGGVTYTPGAAADAFLPGGFSGSWGTPGKTPGLRIGQRLRLTADGRPVYADVVLIVGAARYDDGFVALLAVDSDSAGCAYVTMPA